MRATVLSLAVLLAVIELPALLTALPAARRN